MGNFGTTLANNPFQSAQLGIGLAGLGLAASGAFRDENESFTSSQGLNFSTLFPRDLTGSETEAFESTQAAARFGLGTAGQIAQGVGLGTEGFLNFRGPSGELLSPAEAGFGLSEIEQRIIAEAEGRLFNFGEGGVIPQIVQQAFALPRERAREAFIGEQTRRGLLSTRGGRATQVDRGFADLQAGLAGKEAELTGQLFSQFFPAEQALAGAKLAAARTPFTAQENALSRSLTALGLVSPAARLGITPFTSPGGGSTGTTSQAGTTQGGGGGGGNTAAGVLGLSLGLAQVGQNLFGQPDLGGGGGSPAGTIGGVGGAGTLGALSLSELFEAESAVTSPTGIGGIGRSAPGQITTLPPNAGGGGGASLLPFLRSGTAAPIGGTQGALSGPRVGPAPVGGGGTFGLEGGSTLGNAFRVGGGIASGVTSGLSASRGGASLGGAVAVGAIQGLGTLLAPGQAVIQGVPQLVNLLSGNAPSRLSFNRIFVEPAIKEAVKQVLGPDAFGGQDIPITIRDDLTLNSAVQDLLNNGIVTPEEAAQIFAIASRDLEGVFAGDESGSLGGTDVPVEPFARALPGLIGGTSAGAPPAAPEPIPQELFGGDFFQSVGDVPAPSPTFSDFGGDFGVGGLGIQPSAFQNLPPDLRSIFNNSIFA